MITLLIASFVAGILTILAPCVLPVLPLIVGGSITSKKSYLRASIIVSSLVVSVITFTLLLKASTSLLGVPTYVWQFISAVIIIALGLNYFFPKLWDSLTLGSGVALGSQQLLSKASQKQGWLSAVFTGLALGPVFTSCSPTYLFIVAAILPTEFWLGVVYLALYALGLGLVLLIVSVLGTKLIKRLGWTLNPTGWFRRSLGVIFILLGIAIAFGLDKSLQTYIIDQGLYAPVESIENSLR